MKEMMRKAGKALQGMDDAYSDKIVDMYFGTKDNERVIKNPALATAAGVGATFGGGTRMSDPEGMMAAKATGAVAKYVLPAAGVTLAGKALLDLTASFGTAADMPEQGQLTLQ